jgi:hypothetical protein
MMVRKMLDFLIKGKSLKLKQDYIQHLPSHIPHPFVFSPA